ncbi:MAG TPA: choice-of-anchor D domain-containing protein, partial [Terriglobales bacterium]
MRELEFTAKVDQEQLKRVQQQTRAPQGALVLVLGLALAWLASGVDLNPTAADFGSLAVGKGTKLQRVVLTNRNLTDLAPARISLEGDSRSDFHLNSAACAKLSAGDSCDLLVEFRPRHEGVKLARLVVYTSDGKELSTEFSGTATAAPRPPSKPAPIPAPQPPTQPGPLPPPTPGPTSPPAPPPELPPPVQVAEIHVQPKFMDFSRPNKPRQDLTVLNTGTAPLTVSFSVVGENTDRFAYAAGSCRAAIAPGERCTVVVSYKSKFFSSNRPLSAQLDVRHNDPHVDNPQSVQLKWERVEPPQIHVSVNPGSLQFRGPAQGEERFTPSTQTVTVHNHGPVAMKQLNLRLGFFGGGEKKEFSYSSHCRNTLDVNEECTVDVSYASPNP